MNLLNRIFLVFMISSFTGCMGQNVEKDCHADLLELIVSTEHFLEEINKLNSELKSTHISIDSTHLFSSILTGSPNEEDSSSLTYYSPSYDVSIFYDLSYDYSEGVATYSFLAKEGKLFTSINIGDESIGEHKIKLLEEVEFDKELGEKFLKCIDK